MSQDSDLRSFPSPVASRPSSRMSRSQDIFSYLDAPDVQVNDLVFPKSFAKDDIIIAVMGATGTGKSTLISTLTGRDMNIGHDLASCTRDIVPVFCDRPEVPQKRIVFLDTPGFDDTFRSDVDILETIATWLGQTYSKGVKLSGILYLTRISDNRLSGISLRNLQLFRDLCGTESLGNVVFVTTMWGEVPESLATRRESELITKWWRPVIEFGAQVARFHQPSADSWSIVDSLKDKKATVLQIQQEIINEKKELVETQAGRRVEEQINGFVEKYNKELAAVMEGLRRVVEKGHEATLRMMVQEREELQKRFADAQAALEKLRKPKGWLARLKTRWYRKKKGKQ